MRRPPQKTEPGPVACPLENEDEGEGLRQATIAEYGSRRTARPGCQRACCVLEPRALKFGMARVRQHPERDAILLGATARKHVSGTGRREGG